MARSKFIYKKPRPFYDEENEKYFIQGFGGKKQYFGNEAEYNAFVKLDQEKKYKMFQQDLEDAERMVYKNRETPADRYRKMQNRSLFGMR